MKANPRPTLLDRRARAHLWLLAPLLAASAVSVVVTAQFPPGGVIAVCVAFALGGWTGVWAVRPLSPPDPSSPPCVEDAITAVASAVGVYGRHSLEASTAITATFPQVTA